MTKELTKEVVKKCLEDLTSAHEDLRNACDRCKEMGVEVIYFTPHSIQLHAGIFRLDIESEIQDHSKEYNRHEIEKNGVTLFWLEEKK